MHLWLQLHRQQRVYTYDPVVADSFQQLLLSESVSETDESVPETDESVFETDASVSETDESVPETDESVSGTDESLSRACVESTNIGVN